MHTTLDIDDDVLGAVKDIARSEGRTAGQVLSELARRALTTPSPATTGFAEEQQAGYRVDDKAVEATLWLILPDRQGVIVTPELVRHVQDELDRQDAIPFDFETGEPRRFEQPL
jgi:hypothetical protein